MIYIRLNEDTHYVRVRVAGDFDQTFNNARIKRTDTDTFEIWEINGELANNYKRCTIISREVIIIHEED